MPDNIQRELRSEIQRLIKELNLGTSLYNVETRQGLDGKPYIMIYTEGAPIGSTLKNVSDPEIDDILSLFGKTTL